MSLRDHDFLDRLRGPDVQLLERRDRLESAWRHQRREKVSLASSFLLGFRQPPMRAAYSPWAGPLAIVAVAFDLPHPT